MEEKITLATNTVPSPPTATPPSLPPISTLHAIRTLPLELEGPKRGAVPPRVELYPFPCPHTGGRALGRPPLQAAPPQGVGVPEGVEVGVGVGVKEGVPEGVAVPVGVPVPVGDGVDEALGEAEGLV